MLKVTKSVCQIVFSLSTYRINTISQTITTLAASKPAANTPQICESSVTPRTYRSMYRPLIPGHTTTGGWAPPVVAIRSSLFDRECLVDQLLSVGNFGGELLVGAVLSDLDPGVVFRRRQGDHLDIVFLEGSDHLVVEALGRLIEVILGFLPSLDQRVLLLLVEPVEAPLRH